MTIHRFITSFSRADLVVTEPRIVHQVKKVLRLKPGDHIRLCNLDSFEIEASITSISRNSFSAKFIKDITPPVIPHNISLYVAILKKDNFDLVIQKGTELGVKEFFPLLTDRTIKLKLNKSRLNKIALEASEQSGRTTLPLIHALIPLEDIFLNPSSGSNFVFHPSATNRYKKFSSANLFIGPEGGWSDKELDLFSEHNFTFLSLSPLTLRAETAAITAAFFATHF